MLTRVSIADQIRDAFPFEVNRFPLLGPDHMATPYYGLFRSDNGVCVGRAVSAKYHPHTLDQVINLAEAAAQAFVTPATVDCTWRGSTHYVVVDPGIDFRRSILGNDTVFPRLIVDAGHKDSAFHVTLGYYRDLCDNLSMLESVDSVRVSIPHLATMEAEVEDLVERCRDVAGRWGSMVDLMKAMADKQIDIQSYLAEVLPRPKTSRRSEKYHYDRINAIVQRANEERERLGIPKGSDNKFSGWLLYNSVQGHMQHDQRRVGEPVGLARASMTWDSSIVRRAERLALAG